MSTLILPKCNQDLIPAEIATVNQQVQSKLPSHLSLDKWIEAVDSSINKTPDLILGSDDTPAMAWVAARRLYPEVRALCYESSDKCWRDIDTLDVWSVQPAPEKVENDLDKVIEDKFDLLKQKIEGKLPPEPESKPKPEQKTSRQLSDRDLIFEIFKRTSWGNQERQVKDLLFEATERAEINRSILQEAKRANRQGEQAYKLNQEALAYFNKQYVIHKEDAIDQTFNALIEKNDSIPNKTQKYIKIQLKKRCKFLKSKDSNKDKNTPSTLKPVVLRDGIHPNNIRYMTPSSQWTITIDETGSIFDSSSENLNISEQKLGKVVALVVPGGAEQTLPELRKDYHATNATDAQNDKNVRALLNANVGVFGFSMKDQGLSLRNRWFDAIDQLSYWVMLLLPIDSGQNTTIKFKIEERDYGIGDTKLQLIEEALESRLVSIDPDRFNNIHIKMEFISKDQTNLNGYIDTIAHTWGSKAKPVKERLKRSGWLSHCLLVPNQSAVERLFLASNNQKPLEPNDWYDICSNIAKEPKTSLLHEQLTKLADSTKNDTTLWQTYMDYVSDRLRTKRYHINELGQSLAWLEQAKPDSKSFTRIETLYLQSAKLALLNHEGKVDYALVKEVFDLASQLKDEIPQDCAQIILRIATSTTNNYEFNAAQSEVEKWLSFGVAIPGLLNFAKLHSALGQLKAFQGNNNEAKSEFEKAISCFEQLSNQKSAQRDIFQTQIYKLITQMDSNDNWKPSFDSWLKALKKTHKNLARSGHNDRYLQHTLLRSFITSPELFEQEITEYLALEDEWDNDDDHPWQWINAYRGWLYSIKGNNVLAKQYFSEAVNACLGNDKGITIKWIGSVISLLARKLNLDVLETALSEDYLNNFKSDTSHFPIKELREWQQGSSEQDHKELIEQLQKLVPFNFH